MSDVALQALEATVERTPEAQGEADRLAPETPPAIATWLGVGTALSVMALGCLWMASASG